MLKAYKHNKRYRFVTVQSFHTICKKITVGNNFCFHSQARQTKAVSRYNNTCLLSFSPLGNMKGQGMKDM